MSASLNETPSAERIHIGFFGRMNSGKSSLVNALAGQEISIVSDTAGTTTDPVKKAMEINGLGPCLLIDTAGFDDRSELGGKRVELTEKAAEKTDIAVILFTADDISEELALYRTFESSGVPVVAVISKADFADFSVTEKHLAEEKIFPVVTSALNGKGIPELKKRLVSIADRTDETRTITGGLADDGDVIMLVMPQDIQAPKGRLILPQVQTIRELLDKKCTVISTVTDRMDNALAALAKPPKLIITDSQVYKTVYDKKPPESRITSFSTLFAAYKGDIGYYFESAAVLDKLGEGSHILIAECCTHAPLDGDIARIKLPRLLRKKLGENVKIDVVSGSDFPSDLSVYDLIIQCGACMFNRRYVMSRIERARSQNIPMSNYGVVIAYLNGILDKVEIPD